jgi:hypothetical protein
MAPDLMYIFALYPSSCNTEARSGRLPSPWTVRMRGGKADLKTGAHVFIPRWEKQGDGTWQATVVVVGRDGITPPM